MSSKPSKARILFLLCALIFVLGLGRLFWLRFQAGDFYPPYSSLRGDPLGTQVLFESIQRLDQSPVERNFRPLDQVAIDASTTLLVCGLRGGDPSLADRSWSRLLDRLSSRGGRLVLTFRSAQGDQGEMSGEDEVEESPDETDCPPEDAEADQGPEDAAGSPAGEGAEESDVDRDEPFDLPDLLGFSLEKLSAAHYDDFALLSSDWPEALPEMIPWRSQVALDLQAPAWEVVYWWQDAPVLVQRAWGQGTLVVSLDSYLLSNEALRRDRVTDLLAWWVQMPNRLVVDEFHHGLVKQPGIADLARKYRLQGAAAALLVVVVLLVWRQAAPFAPAPAQSRAAAEETAVGQDAHEGWVGLMQQHIPADDLLRVCHEAWRASPAVNRVPDARVAGVAQLVAAAAAEARGRRHPVTVYRQICQLLKEGKHS